MTSMRTRRAAIALLLAGASITVPAWALAGDKNTSQQSAPTLAEVGMQLEWARARTLAEREAAMSETEHALAEALSAGSADGRRAAAQLLAGEIHYARGDFRAAAEAFRDAARSDKRGPFADDAAFGAIEALEAHGDDEEAAKQWVKWEKKNPDSPLAPEVKLARTWNALRRVALKEAAGTLEELGARYPWMQNDPRVGLATATLAYLGARIEDALVALTPDVTGASASFLRALCQDAQGARLKAAALYQEVVDRYPESRLRDHALIAKANTFLDSKAYRSAAEEFGRVTEMASTPEVGAEAALRRAAALVLDEDYENGTVELRAVTQAHAGTGVAARAQFLLGEVLYVQQRHKEAIVEFNRVLTSYFEHELAAAAQYRVGLSLDALGRGAEATGSYQAVVSGYPLQREAPAAAYLAGVGLLDQGLPLAAAPYFQIVLDRYAHLDESASVFVFETPEHQELVEAALALLQLSYHRAGDLGQLSGVPHLTLQQMPPSRTNWRAFALLIDADALASQGRHEEAQVTLEALIRDFPEHEVSILANRLLAWTYAQQGQDQLAIETEERMLQRYAASGNPEYMATAYLNKAHVLFNRKSYVEAAAAYEDFLRRFPQNEGRLQALYQAGVAYSRLDQNGDAVDRWQALVQEAPTAGIAEQAWVRAGDLYFRAEHYDKAKASYAGLLENFANSPAAAMASLRLAQCDYNAGRDAEALQRFSDVAQRYAGTEVGGEAERGTELALYRLGQQEGGMQVLAELVDRYPSSSFAADAQFKIAMHHYDAKRFTEAADAFRRVVTQFPGFSAVDQAHFLMADAYEQTEAAREALRGYEQFLMFFPESELRSTAQFRLAMLHFGGSDYMRAAVQFTSVLDSEGTDEMKRASLYNLGLCQRMLEDSDAAKQTLERYRAAHPQDERAADIAYQIGDIHDKSGAYDLALAEFEKALASKPSQALRVELRYRVGGCHEQLGNVDAALVSYGKAMKAKEKSNAFRLSAVVRVAALHEERGDYKKALVAYRDLVRNAEDAELVAAAKERAAELETTVQ
jgi:TolA-binding protein